MATKVQKKVLWWMIDNGGELYISAGHKRVLHGRTEAFGKKNELYCLGNQNLIIGLEANGYATRMYQLTEENTIETTVVNGKEISRTGTPLTKEQRILHSRFRIVLHNATADACEGPQSGRQVTA